MPYAERKMFRYINAQDADILRFAISVQQRMKNELLKIDIDTANLIGAGPHLLAMLVVARLV